MGSHRSQQEQVSPDGRKWTSKEWKNKGFNQGMRGNPHFLTVSVNLSYPLSFGPYLCFTSAKMKLI